MSKDVDTRLSEVYGATSQRELSETYDNWATSYDADMLSTGYAHPAIICGLISRYVSDFVSPIMDAGVGTGNMGRLLHTLGYGNLHGLDMSQGMLNKARGRGVYAGLHLATLGQTLEFFTASFAAVISTGTFTTGHAPASAFDELSRIIRPGGHLIFTVGTKVWTENGFAAKLEELTKSGMLKPVWSSDVYHPMPFSKAESKFTTRAHVYQRV